MSGRPRLDIGTYGTVTVTRLDASRYRAATLYRDDDGRSRRVTATGTSRNDATASLKRRLLDRRSVGDTGGSLAPGSPFPELARQWLESVQLDAELSPSTKQTYSQELRTLVLPAFESFTIREVTVARIERFLKAQRTKSYATAKHSKTLLSLVMAFAVRHEALEHNPVSETSTLRKPPSPPRALSTEEIAQIRHAARAWRTGDGLPGPRPDGLVPDLIEVMLGSALRIGEALALRGCDIDADGTPPTISVSGTIVVHTGVGVHRQAFAKTASSHRVVAIPTFAAAVLRRRKALLSEAGDEGLLFATRRGTPVYPHNVRRTFREILTTAGLEGRDIRPHSFRKTGATVISVAAGDEAAARALGHTGVQMTRSHYIERAKQADPATAAILERLAPDPMPGSGRAEK